MKDRHGNEWVMVPAKATDEMIAEMLAEKDFDGIWPSAIAAAPKFEAVGVDDEAARAVADHFLENVATASRGIRTGRAMIAAVRSELGPALGLVSREEMAQAIKATDDAASECDYMLDSDDCIRVIHGELGPDDFNARKQLESK